MMNGRRKSTLCAPTVYYKTVKGGDAAVWRGYLDEKKRATTSAWLLAISQVFLYASDRVRWPRLFIALGIRVNTKMDAGSPTEWLWQGRWILELGSSGTKSSGRANKETVKARRNESSSKARNYNALGKAPSNSVILQHDFICASTLRNVASLMHFPNPCVLDFLNTAE